jgi:hypothetical protein
MNDITIKSRGRIMSAAPNKNNFTPAADSLINKLKPNRACLDSFDETYQFLKGSNTHKRMLKSPNLSSSL